MVVTDLPATAESGVTHEKARSPSMCTMQAPQSPIPHPNLVPVNPNCSRRHHSSRELPSRSADTGLPLRVKVITGLLTGSRPGVTGVGVFGSRGPAESRSFDVEPL